MAGMSSIREALIAEVVGDLVKVVDELHAAQDAMEASRRGLLQALAEQAAGVQHYQTQVVALAEKAKLNVAQHVLARADVTVRATILKHQDAMEKAANESFNRHVIPSMRAWQAHFDQLFKSREAGWWQVVLHTYTGLLTSAVTWMALRWA
jgi:hypothetical protein